MSRLELDVTSIPTLTNGGLVLILLAVLACVVLAMLKRPSGRMSLADVMVNAQW